jgi:beta-mannosidase
MTSLSEGQQYLHSFDYKLHDNSVADWRDGEPIYMLREKLGFDVKLHDGLTIPDYTYYGGFLHGEGLTEYIINFRRRMNDTTGSAIFWMYNDCWPATRSWTTIDYLRNRTPAFWGVKRSFAPVTVDIVKTAGGFDVYGVNEWLEEKQGKLTFGYMLPSGEVESKTVDVTLAVNNSCVLASIDGTTLPAGAIPFAELDVAGEPIARRRWVDKAYNELGLVKSDIKVTLNGDGTATYTSDKLVLGVCLDLDGDDGELSDNFFDLYPGRPYTVKLGSKSGEVLYSYMG